MIIDWRINFIQKTMSGKSYSRALRFYLRTCLPRREVFYSVHAAHKYQILATRNFLPRRNHRKTASSRSRAAADVDADAIQYGGGRRSCAWPTDLLSRNTSACATLCHGNAKPGYTRRAPSFHFRRLRPEPKRRRLRGFAWKCMTPHCNYVNGRGDRPIRALGANIDSFRDYGKGLCIRLPRTFFFKEFL